MNRRSFLSAVVGLAVSGALLTSSQVVLAADALSKPGEPVSKFITVLNKGRSIAAMQQELEQSGNSGQALALRSSMYAEFDSLCAFLHDNFDTLPVHSQVREMMASSSDERSFDFESDEQALAVAEELVPLAVLRELIRHHGVEVSVKDAPNYRLVAQRYVGVLRSRHPMAS